MRLPRHPSLQSAVFPMISWPNDADSNRPWQRSRPSPAPPREHCSAILPQRRSSSGSESSTARRPQRRCGGGRPAKYGLWAYWLWVSPYGFMGSRMGAYGRRSYALPERCRPKPVVSEVRHEWQLGRSSRVITRPTKATGHWNVGSSSSPKYMLQGLRRAPIWALWALGAPIWVHGFHIWGPYGGSANDTNAIRDMFYWSLCPNPRDSGPRFDSEIGVFGCHFSTDLDTKKT